MDLTFVVPPDPHAPLHWPPIPNDGHEALNHSFDTFLPPIENRIRAVTTIEEVMALQTELEGYVDLVTFSRLSFEALLANQAMFHSIHSFLRNPAVNVAEASNFATFFAHPLAANISPEAYDKLVETLQSGIKVGCVLQSEIGAIVRSIKVLAHDVFRLSTLRKRCNKLLKAYQAIWDGLKACRVTTTSSTVALQLLDEVISLRTLPKSEPLRRELRWYAWSLSQMDEANLAEMLAEWARLACLGSLDACPKIRRKIDREILLDVLNILSSENHLQTVISTTRHLAERCTKATDDSREWKDTLKFWLGCLQSLESFQPNLSCHGSVLHPSLNKKSHFPIPLTAGWRGVYSVLSARLPMTELADHFKSLPVPEACRILLKFWIPHLLNEANVTTGNQPCKQSKTFSRLNVAFEKKLAERVRNSEELQSLSFAAILFALSRSGLNYGSSAEWIIDLVFKMYGPIVLVRVMKRCIEFRLQFPRRPLDTIIENLAEGQPRLAYFMWRCCRIEVSHFPRLLISLIQGSWVHSAEIFQMLQCKGMANPVLMDKPLVRYLPHVQSQNDLLHLIALAFANSKGGSTRVAFRNVEFCYWYLVEHHSRLQPSMARALVHAGIIRPLQNNEHINFGRCRWILEIVRKLEGDGVADQLNTVIWRWRANIRRSLPSGPRIGKEPHRKWVRRWRSGVPVASWHDLTKEIKRAVAFVRRSRENEQKAASELLIPGWCE